MLDIYRYEVTDWDDPEVDPSPETNNLLHCQQADHLGPQAELIVYEVFQGEWANVKFRTQTAQYAVVGVALSRIWLILLEDSPKARRLAQTRHGMASGGRRDSRVGEGNRAGMEGKAMSVDRPQELVEGSGQRGEQRRLDQMVSARLDPMLVAAVRDYAKRHGMSVSDVFREAAVRLLELERTQNVTTFRVNVTNETRPDGISRDSYSTDVPAAV
jgi:hypothetical protein